MPYTVQVIRTTQQRWEPEGNIPCFSWPTSEVTRSEHNESVGTTVLANSTLPNWRYRVSRGLQATTHYAAQERALEYVPGYIYLGKWCGGFTQRFAHYSLDGDLFSNHSSVWNEPPAVSTLEDDITRDIALSRAIKDARSKQSHFRGGNFLAELADTIRGLRNPVKGFRNLIDTYHRNARKRVKRAVGRRSTPVTQQQFRDLERDSPDVARAAQRALSDSWLEANFGWAPLLGDAVDAYHALRALKARAPLARFYGRAERDDPPTSATNTRSLQITLMRFTVLTWKRYECKFYGAVKLDVDGPPSGQAVEEFGVKAKDFFPAVWEAIPYSFLIDYFSNVGDIIEAVSFPRSELAWMARTFQNHSIRSTDRVAIVEPSSPAFPASNSNVVWHFVPPRVKWDLKYTDRVPYSGSTVPSLRFEIPGSKNWKKWCNIAALARLRTL